MIPSAASVVRGRYWFSVGVRVVALAWLAFGVRALPEQFLSTFLTWTGGGSPFGGGAPRPSIWFNFNGMPGVLFVVKDLLAAFAIPALLVLFEKRLAHWVIPTPRHACPECGYALTNLKTPLCPECGSDVRLVRGGGD